MTQPVRLFATKNRDDAHAQLEKLLASKKHPQAECREDPNDADSPYQVWSGPAVREPDNRPPPAAAVAAAPSNLSDADVARIAAAIAAQMKAGG